MKKVALFYWPKGGAVNHIAGLMKRRADKIDIDVFSIDELADAVLSNYDAFIFGGSTVGADYWLDDKNTTQWPSFFKQLAVYKDAFEGKNAALFGLGNGVMYPDHFVNDMFEMKNHLAPLNLNFVGEVSDESYDYNESKACINGKFIGLAVDEDNEPEHSERRVIEWLTQIEQNL